MKRLILPAIVALAALSLLAATGLAKKDSSERGWLGVYTQSVDYDLAEAFDLDVPYGAIINEVVEDSPAEKAGLQSGDVVISLNDNKITDADDLTDVMYETAPGDRLELVIIRDGREQSIILDAGEAPRRERVTYHRFYHDDEERVVVPELPTTRRAYLGVSLDNLNEQLGAYFGVDEGKGALVTEVMEDSPAEKAGLKAGDVIVSIDGEPVGDASDVRNLIRDYEKGDQIDIAIIRDHRADRFTAELEEREQLFFGHGAIVGPDMAKLNMPKLHGLFKGNYMDDFEFDFDSEEFEREMAKLAEELSKLKFEFKDLEELGFDREELRREMEQLRRELKDLQVELHKELQDLRDEQQ